YRRARGAPEWVRGRSARTERRRAARSRSAHRGRRPRRRATSLDHVALPLTIILDGLARPRRRREVELQRVAALPAALVRELAPVDLTRRADDLAVLVLAALRWLRRRHDLLRVLVAGSLLVRVPDDVLHHPVVLGLGVLLANVASDSSQLAILVAVSLTRHA